MGFPGSPPGKIGVYWGNLVQEVPPPLHSNEGKMGGPKPPKIDFFQKGGFGGSKNDPIFGGGGPKTGFWGSKKRSNFDRKNPKKVPIKSPHIFCAKYVLKLT